MKILFLTPRESKTNLGGVERHVKLLAEELVRRGHEVKELSLDEVNKSYKGYKNYKEGERGEKDQKDEKGEGNTQKDKKEKGKTRRIFFKFLVWKYLWDRRELFRWAEVIHVHDVFWWYAPFAVLNRIGLVGSSFNLFNKVVERDTNDTNEHPNDTNRMTKTKVFVTFHGWEGRYPPTWVAVWQKRLAAFLSGGTIGVGSFFEKWYGVKPDRVVWGAIDKSYKNYKEYKSFKERGKGEKEKEKKDQKEQKGEGKAAFLGRLEEVNGIEIVIEAAERLNKERERGEKDQRDEKEKGNTGRILFLFVGDGSYRGEAEKVGRVTGMVREPWKYLVDADVVIASSYLAILEAAAMGKRIIAVADNPLKRDYLEGHPLRGYFKVVGSAEELIEAMADKDYKSYKDYKEKGEGKSWALGQTAEKLADEYLELWSRK